MVQKGASRIATFTDTGYEGYRAHEFRPKGDPVQALEAAVRTCDI